MHLEHNEWSKQESRKGNWKALLGDHFMEIPDYKTVAKRIAEVVIQNHKPSTTSAKSSTASSVDIDVENML